MRVRYQRAVVVALLFGRPAFCKPQARAKDVNTSAADRKKPAAGTGAFAAPHGTSFALGSGDAGQRHAGQAIDLDLPLTEDKAEQIVVHGSLNPRRQREDPDFRSPVGLGPMTVTSATDTHLPGHTVLVVTGAIPVGGVSGLDAVVNLAGESGPHEQRDNAGPIFDAGPPVGFRLKF